MTMNKIMGKLRRKNKNQYTLLGICMFLSVLLVTSFTLMYFSPTVQELLPQGGDTRKLSWLMMGVTFLGCTVFTFYGANLFFRNKSRETHGTVILLRRVHSAICWHMRIQTQHRRNR